MKIERKEKEAGFIFEHGMSEEEVCSFIAAEFNEPLCNVAEMPREDGYVVIVADSDSGMFYSFWDNQMHSFHSLEEIVELFAEREYMKTEFNFGVGELKLTYEIDVKR